MSEDEFGDESLFLDDSFLRQVDDIAARAAKPPPKPSHTAALPRSASSNLASHHGNKNLSGVPRTFSAPVPFKPPPRAATASSSKLTVTKPASAPSSDDFDLLDFPPEDLEALNAIISEPPTGPPRNMFQTQLAPTLNPNYAPNPQSELNSNRSGPSRSSGSTRTSAPSNGVQTHLNWRTGPRYTPGKRWDRTIFAKTGRRLVPLARREHRSNNDKGKGKQDQTIAPGWDSMAWSEEEEEDEYMGDVLAPPPQTSFNPNVPYGPQRQLPSPTTLQTYIYPTNRSRRDYQFDIVRHCFMDNTLVALPTGLGKTFVAGVVMLNFYRWFPTGKIVFLAPTRPLVQQQIEACQLSCGIPSRDTAVMTGQSERKKERERLWDERRVFYCTPQTLENDLKSGAVDPQDIVLVVFDEAHKATGNFAYTTILAYITAHHPYFRVLALTATPGSDVEKVQNVVDALHISRIEIREAEAPEIKKYMNTKHISQHVVEMSDTISGFRDRWAALMVPYVKKLVEKDILGQRDLDVKRLRPFKLTSIKMELIRKKGNMAFVSPLSQIEKMARGMSHLLEFSLGMFNTSLNEMVTGRSSSGSGKKTNTKSGSSALANNYEFQSLQRDVNEELNSIRIGRNGKNGADKHPKMRKALDLLLAHFSQAEEEEKTLGQRNDTRAMVFCSFRSCVMEIVDMLNEHSGLLRAVKFVGQSQGKEENDKGFNQKEQKATINDFKAGKFNILVATSIGEEGLDIGEVDFVVLYDMPKQSIKLLQRIGRTGRKRDGQVHVLMSENREDMNWDTAQQTHRDIQEEILHSRNLELFEDVEPLLPDRKMPECVEQEMAIDPWNPDDPNFKKEMASVEKEAKKQAKKLGVGKASEGTKTKRKNKMRDEVPAAAKGFTSVADLLREAGRIIARSDSEDEETDPDTSMNMTISTKARAKAPAKARTGVTKRRCPPSPIRSESGSDEEQDIETLFSRYDEGRSAKMEREARMVGIELPTRRQEPHPKEKSKKTSTLSRSMSSNMPTTEPAGRSEAEKAASLAKEGRKRSILNAIKIHAMDNDKHSSDSDITPVSPLPKRHKASPVPQKPHFAQAQDLTSGDIELDFFRPEGPLRRGFSPIPLESPSPKTLKSPDNSPRYKSLFSSPPARSRAIKPSLAVNVVNQLRPQSSPIPSSPVNLVNDEVLIPASPGSPGQLPKAAVTNKLSPRTAAAAGFSQIDPMDLSSWDGDDWQMSSPPRRPVVQALGTPAGVAKSAMPPPPLPSTTKKAILSSPFVPPAGCTDTPLGTQFPIRHLTSRRVRPTSAPGSSESPIAGVKSAAGVVDSGSSPMVNLGIRRGGIIRRRIIMDDSSSPPRDDSVQISRAERLQRPNPRAHEGRENEAKITKKRKGPLGKFVELDADLSGSDSGDSSEHSASSIETDSDRRFAGNFAATQVSKKYNQQAAYLAGLGTQAHSHGLKFKRDMAQERDNFLSKAKRPVYVTDDEDGAPGRSSENEYELGSFVVDDEDDMGYVSRSDSLYD